MPIYLRFSHEEFKLTSRQIRNLKIAQLRSLCRCLEFSYGGTRNNLLRNIFLYFDTVNDAEDAAGLAAMKDLLRRIEENHPLVTYNEVHKFYSSRGKSRPRTPSASSAEGLHSQDSHPVRDHDINFIDNPFFRLIRKIHVSPQVCLPKKGKNDCYIDFVFDVAEYKLLKKEDPNLRIYLICGRKMTENRVSDDVEIEWPLPHDLYVNDQKIDTKYKGLRHKPGTAKPVDLTELLLVPPKLNKIRINYEDHEETYYVYLYFVRLIPFETVIENIKAQPKIHKNHTIASIKKNTKDLHLEGIEIEDIILSLRDHYTYTKIEIPVKTINCDHLQCFDLRICMTQQYESPTWQCPHCRSRFEVSDLAICEYFEEILNNLKVEVDSVKIAKDGQWSPCIEKKESRPDVKLERLVSGVKREPDAIVNLTGDVGVGLSDDENDIEVLLSDARITRVEDLTPFNGHKEVRTTITAGTLNDALGISASKNYEEVQSEENTNPGTNNGEHITHNIAALSTNSSLVTPPLASIYTSSRGDQVPTQFQRQQLQSHREQSVQPQQLKQVHTEQQQLRQHQLQQQLQLQQSQQEIHQQQHNEQQQVPQHISAQTGDVAVLQGPIITRRFSTLSRKAPNEALNTQQISTQSHPHSQFVHRNYTPYHATLVPETPFFAPSLQNVTQEIHAREEMNGVLSPRNNSLQQLQGQCRAALISQSTTLPCPEETMDVLDGNVSNYSQASIASRMMQPKLNRQQYNSQSIISRNMLTPGQRKMQQNIKLLALQQEKQLLPIQQRAPTQSALQHLAYTQQSLHQQQLHPLLQTQSHMHHTLHQKRTSVQHFLLQTPSLEAQPQCILNQDREYHQLQGLNAQQSFQNRIEEPIQTPASASNNSGSIRGYSATNPELLSTQVTSKTTVGSSRTTTRNSTIKLDNYNHTNEPKNQQNAEKILQHTGENNDADSFLRSIGFQPHNFTSSLHLPHQFLSNEPLLERQAVGQTEPQAAHDCEQIDSQHSFNTSVERAAFAQLERILVQFESDTQQTLQQIKLECASDSFQKEKVLRHYVNFREIEKQKAIDEFMKNYFDIVGNTLNLNVTNGKGSSVSDNHTALLPSGNQMHEVRYEDGKSPGPTLNSSTLQQRLLLPGRYPQTIDCPAPVLTISAHTKLPRLHSLSDPNGIKTKARASQLISPHAANAFKETIPADPSRTLVNSPVPNPHGHHSISGFSPQTKPQSPLNNNYSLVTQTLSPDSVTTEPSQLKKGLFKIGESFFDDSKTLDYVIPANDMKENSTVPQKDGENLRLQQIIVDITSQSKGERLESDLKQARSIFEEMETSPTKKQKLMEILKCELDKDKLINKFQVFQDYTLEPADMKRMKGVWVQRLKEKEKRIDQIVSSGSSKNPIVLDSDTE